MCIDSERKTNGNKVMETIELTCKDLMIGDWVSYGGTPIKVENVYEDCINFQHDIPFVQEELLIEQTEIEPIPLTAEILEKNGFEKNRTCDEKPDEILQCVEGDIIIEVGIYDPNFISISYRHETPDGIGGGELSSIVKVDGGKIYLHELQHALKLCGITHEINL